MAQHQHIILFSYTPQPNSTLFVPRIVEPHKTKDLRMPSAGSVQSVVCCASADADADCALAGDQSDINSYTYVMSGNVFGKKAAARS